MDFDPLYIESMAMNVLSDICILLEIITVYLVTASSKFLYRMNMPLKICVRNLQ